MQKGKDKQGNCSSEGKVTMKANLCAFVGSEINHGRQSKQYMKSNIDRFTKSIGSFHRPTITAAGAATTTTALSSTVDTSEFNIISSSSMSDMTLSTISSTSTSSIVVPEGSSTDAVVAKYEAIMPSTEVLIGYGIIVILCVIVSWVWANQVVPTSRTNLAISKNRGEVKQYLDELKAMTTSSDPSNNGFQQEQEQQMVNNGTTTIDEDGMTSTVAVTSNTTETTTTTTTTKENKNNNRAFERWLFTDWLQDNKSSSSLSSSSGRKQQGGRQKEPALPILKNAKWNSGDNPILVATALISLGVIFTSVTERIIVVAQ